MRTVDAAEIIEVLDSKGDAFSLHSTEPTPADRGGRRWVGPAAMAALVALIAYGVWSSSSTTRPPEVAATSTAVRPVASPPPTTRPVPQTTVAPQPLVPYYAADLPRQYRLQGADAGVFNGGGSSGGLYQLWAAPDSAAAAGSWFSLRYYRGGGANLVLGAHRVSTAKGALAIASRPDGRIEALLADPAGVLIVNAYGWNEADIVRLVETTTVDARTLDPFTLDPATTRGHHLVGAVEPWTAVLGAGEEQVFYSTIDQSSSIVITVSTLDGPSGGSDGSLDRDTAIRFLLDHATSFSVAGHPAVAGSLAGSTDSALATWVAGDHSVTVSGNVSAEQILEFAQSVHEVSRNEWAGMQFQAQRNASEPAGIAAYQETERVPVSFGTDANGGAWRIDASVMTWSSSRWIGWQWADGSYVTAVVDGPAITTFAGSGRTYVVAILPRGSTAGQLTVAVGDSQPVAIPFNDIDPTLDHLAAAYAFSEPDTYTAEIVNPNGAVLAEWPGR